MSLISEVDSIQAGDFLSVFRFWFTLFKVWIVGVKHLRELEKIHLEQILLQFDNFR